MKTSLKTQELTPQANPTKVFRIQLLTMYVCKKKTLFSMAELKNDFWINMYAEDVTFEAV